MYVWMYDMHQVTADPTIKMRAIAMDLRFIHTGRPMMGCDFINIQQDQLTWSAGMHVAVAERMRSEGMPPAFEFADRRMYVCICRIYSPF